MQLGQTLQPISDSNMLSNFSKRSNREVSARRPVGKQFCSHSLVNMGTFRDVVYFGQTLRKRMQNRGDKKATKSRGSQPDLSCTVSLRLCYYQMILTGSRMDTFSSP